MTEGSGTHRTGLKVVKEAVSEDMNGDSLIKNAFPKGNGESTGAQGPGFSHPQQPRAEGGSQEKQERLERQGVAHLLHPDTSTRRTVASHPHSAILSFNTIEPRQYSTQAPKLKGHW